ncbi:MAG: SLC13 family permease, partial [Gammaproteobacteria bacterium]|nr:SLC13 family permease [Gammaproteobacteria bacterium]
EAMISNAAADGDGAVAFVYLWLIAPRLLPDRDIQLAGAAPRLFEARLRLTDQSPAVGNPLSDAIALCDGKLRAARIRRGEMLLMPLPGALLKAGDQLRVRDTRENLKLFEDTLKASLHSVDSGDNGNGPLSEQNQSLAEIAVVAGSRLDGANLRSARFLDQFQLVVLAVHRAGKEVMSFEDNIARVVLQPGDILLVQGAGTQIARLKRSTDFLVLDATADLPEPHKAKRALTIFVGVVACAASGLMPISVSATAGACLLLLTRCLNVGPAIRAINSSVFFVIVASLALGKALVETGATNYLTEVFLVATLGADHLIVLGALMALLAVLTNVVSNNAAAVIGTPIAIGIANNLGLPPEPFVLAVLFGANMSFATPMAYQTNLLVMAAGNYRFLDFVRVGVPLTVIMLLTLTWALGRIYF